MYFASPNAKHCAAGSAVMILSSNAAATQMDVVPDNQLGLPSSKTFSEEATAHFICVCIKLFLDFPCERTRR